MNVQTFGAPRPLMLPVKRLFHRLHNCVGLRAAGGRADDEKIRHA